MARLYITRPTATDTTAPYEPCTRCVGPGMVSDLTSITDSDMLDFVFRDLRVQGCSGLDLRTKDRR